MYDYVKEKQAKMKRESNRRYRLKKKREQNNLMRVSDISEKMRNFYDRELF